MQTYFCNEKEKHVFTFHLFLHRLLLLRVLPESDHNLSLCHVSFPLLTTEVNLLLKAESVAPHSCRYWRMKAKATSKKCMKHKHYWCNIIMCSGFTHTLISHIASSPGSNVLVSLSASWLWKQKRRSNLFVDSVLDKQMSKQIKIEQNGFTTNGVDRETFMQCFGTG